MFKNGLKDFKAGIMRFARRETFGVLGGEAIVVLWDINAYYLDDCIVDRLTRFL